jgi:hypothetical protein
MSRLRRLVLFDRFFFITCRLLPHRRMVEESEFECLAGVVRERREKHHFVLTAWVFLPDPAAAGHAIIFPRFPVTISRVMDQGKAAESLKNETLLFRIALAARRGLSQ